MDAALFACKPALPLLACHGLAVGMVCVQVCGVVFLPWVADCWRLTLGGWQVASEASAAAVLILATRPKE